MEVALGQCVEATLRRPGTWCRVFFGSGKEQKLAPGSGVLVSRRRECGGSVSSMVRGWGVGGGAGRRRELRGSRENLGQSLEGSRHEPSVFAAFPFVLQLGALSLPLELGSA